MIYFDPDDDRNTCTCNDSFKLLKYRSLSPTTAFVENTLNNTIANFKPKQRKKDMTDN